MAFNFSTSVLPTSDNTCSLGSASKRWKINDQEITFDTIYPIGAVYISVTECNPGQLFGGTWEQITGKFLLACDTTYTNGSTGGSATMSHTHTMAHTHTMSHTHTQVATTSGGPSNNTSGSTAITVAQMPSHNHGSSGQHRHVVKSDARGEAYTDYLGGSTKVKIIPDYMAGAWSNPLYATDAGSHTHTSQGSGSGHTHTLSSHTHSTSATTTGGASNATTSAASNATTSAASNDNNMPPYLAVYMYKRIA